MVTLDKIVRSLLFLLVVFTLVCQTDVSTIARQDTPSLFSTTSAKPKLSEIQSEEVRKLLKGAINKQIRQKVMTRSMP